VYEVNWHRISQAVSQAQALEGAPQEAFLSKLENDAPDIYGRVKDIVKNKNLFDAFMMTAVGDYLLPEPSLYKVGDTVGLWKIESQIGSGGMGDVYKATRADALYDQTVALKVMKGNDLKRKARFNDERRRLAALNHAGIASIFDGGVSEEGYSFMAMEYVEGLPIHKFSQSQNLNRTQNLNLFLRVCDAVAYAHNNLILHRDLKSENILVSENADIKLVDFGIAKLLDNSEDKENYGPFSILSAAPEQLNGQPLSVQTDVFALGSLLHQLLFNSFPQRQPSGAVRSQIKGLSPDLIAILQKALKTEPDLRYSSVANLSSDVAAFANSRPVKAYEGSNFYKLRKLIRRAPVASTLSIGFLASLIVGIGASQHFARTAQAEAVRANEELEVANWHRQVSEVDTKMSDAYAEGLHYAFGQEKSDNLSGLLIDYHAKTMEEYRDTDPEYTAYTSFVIGEHFIRRNDFRNGRLILEPWVMEEYGPSKLLLALGQAMLGHAYKEMNEIEGAAKLFSKSASFYVGTPGEHSTAHTMPATLAGILSSDRAVENEASEIIDHVLKTTESNFVKIFFLSRRASLELKRKNYDASYDALQQAMEIINSGRAGNFQEEHKLRIRLAFLEIFHKKSFSEAHRQIRLIQDNSQLNRGEGMTIAESYLYKSVMAWAVADHEAASTDLSEANRLMKRYNSDAKNPALLLLHSGVLNADLQNFKLAQNDLAALRNQTYEDYIIWSQVLEIYILARRDGMEAAQSKYDKTNFINDEILDNLEYRFYLDVLIEDGLKI